MAHFFGEVWVCGHGSRVERVALRTGSSARCARWESELTMHGTSVAGALGGAGDQMMPNESAGMSASASRPPMIGPPRSPISCRPR